MGMPEQPQSGMNIAPDGTVYEILDDGTIKRIGKVSPDGSFEPFGGTKDGIREKNGIIYRVINGKEVKIGRILPNGEIETINQRIKSETEIARNKVKIVTIVSVCCLIAFLAILYSFNSQQQAKVKAAEINARIRQEELAAQERRAEEERKRKEAEAKKAEEVRRTEQAKAEQAKADAKKAEAERKRTKTEPLTELSEEDERALERIIERNIPHLQKKEAEEERKRKEAETKKAEEERKRKEAAAKKAEEVRKAEQAKAEQAKAEQAKAEAKKAEEERKRKEVEAKKAQTGGGTKIGSLYWSDRSLSKMNWNSVKEYCENLTEGGYSDWRLPNIDELRTLIQNHSGTQTGGTCKISEKAGKLAWSDRSGECDGRNGSNFSKLGDDVLLWSSSTYVDNTNSAWYVWYVYFGNGAVYDNDKTNISIYVRCVR